MVKYMHVHMVLKCYWFFPIISYSVLCYFEGQMDNETTYQKKATGKRICFSQTRTTLLTNGSERGNYFSDRRSTSLWASAEKAVCCRSAGSFHCQSKYFYKSNGWQLDRDVFLWGFGGICTWHVKWKMSFYVEGSLKSSARDDIKLSRNLI